VRLVGLHLCFVVAPRIANSSGISHICFLSVLWFALEMHSAERGCEYGWRALVTFFERHESAWKGTIRRQERSEGGSMWQRF